MFTVCCSTILHHNFRIIANQSSLKNGYNELTHSYFMIAGLQDFLGWESIRKASKPAFIY